MLEWNLMGLETGRSCRQEGICGLGTRGQANLASPYRRGLRRANQSEILHHFTTPTEVPCDSFFCSLSWPSWPDATNGFTKPRRRSTGQREDKKVCLPTKGGTWAARTHSVLIARSAAAGYLGSRSSCRGPRRPGNAGVRSLASPAPSNPAPSRPRIPAPPNPLPGPNRRKSGGGGRKPSSRSIPPRPVPPRPMPARSMPAPRSPSKRSTRSDRPIIGPRPIKRWPIIGRRPCSEPKRLRRWPRNPSSRSKRPCRNSPRGGGPPWKARPRISSCRPIRPNPGRNPPRLSCSRYESKRRPNDWEPRCPPRIPRPS